MNKESWFERNKENFIALAIVALLGIVLALTVPGFTKIVIGTLNILWIGLLVVLGIVYLVLPAIIAGFMPPIVDLLDEALGAKHHINGFLKFVLKFVAGVVVTVLFVVVLGWLTYVPLYGGAYQMVGDLARFREMPQSAYGWLIWAFIAYVFGWWIGASVRNGY